MRRRGMLANIPKLVLPSPEPTVEMEWHIIAKSGYVRPKYLFWTPEDIMEMDDKETLLWLREKYRPLSQPQNIVEELYFKAMIDAVNERLHEL